MSSKSFKTFCKYAANNPDVMDKLKDLLNKGQDWLAEVDKDPQKRMMLATGVGAGLGGLTGAGIAGKGSRLKGALIGAGLGGAAGAGASYTRGLYKDLQSKEKDLAKEKAGRKADNEASKKQFEKSFVDQDYRDQMLLALLKGDKKAAQAFRAKIKNTEDLDKILGVNIKDWRGADALPFMTSPKGLRPTPAYIHRDNRSGLKNIQDDYATLQKIIDRLRLSRVPGVAEEAKALSVAPAPSGSLWTRFTNSLNSLQPAKVSPQAALENWASMYPGH